MASHAWVTKVREEDRVIIGGFQSELEKDVLKFLLRGICPIIVVRANRCPKTMPEELRAASDYIGDVRANLQCASKDSFLNDKLLPRRLMAHFGIAVKDIRIWNGK